MYKKIKPVMERIIALFLVFVSFPILFFIALLFKMVSNEPIFFCQERVGYKGCIINVYKLRTMKVKTRDKHGRLLSDSERLTKIGAVLRKLSLDELPQLWNVLRGEMSFIGPRPLLTRYYPYYTDEENRRHDVLPGITGLAQVNGRNSLCWNDRLVLDVYYVDHLSLALDFSILVKTILKVVQREKVLTRDHNPMLDLDEERKGHEIRKGYDR